MEIKGALCPELAQLTNIAAELRVEYIHGPEQRLLFRFVDLPRRGSGGSMNGGWSQIYSFYYRSLGFEGRGFRFPHDAAFVGLRVIGTGPGEKITMCIKVKSPECEVSLNGIVLQFEKAYKIPNECMLSLASKNTPDLYLTLNVNWRFLPLDDLWRDVPHNGQAASNSRKRICPG